MRILSSATSEEEAALYKSIHGFIHSALFRRQGKRVPNWKLSSVVTLLKTLEIHTWGQIGMFGAVLVLRVVLKQLFVWEKGRVERRTTSASPT